MTYPRSTRSFEETTLQAVEGALRDVWEVLKAREPSHDWDTNSEFQEGLAATLMDLADAGVTDREELRKRALEILMSNHRVRSA